MECRLILQKLIVIKNKIQEAQMKFKLIIIHDEIVKFKNIL